MNAVPTSAGRPARVRNARRRRLVTGCSLAALVLVALGLSLAAAEPSLKDQIDSAQGEAGKLSDRVDAQTDRIAALTEQARQAGARAMVLNAQVERAEDRSRALGAQLTDAQQQLDRARAEYADAVLQLNRRLVEIYETEAPSYSDVLLNADGFDDLSTRSNYLEALHDADVSVANRVASLRDEIAGHVHRIADLKRSVEAEAAQLAADKESLQAAESLANQNAAAVAGLRSQTQSSLSDVQAKIDELEQQQAEQQSAGAPAYEGGPYAIPTYIVMCESGGNYAALNPSSGAGGAYQILPSTWHAYGAQGLPHQASKAEQDRIAAMIWADSGPSAWSCA
jgi:septal ring factor EnvC (AmiA/AmiB activator)